ncbi:MAG TPA: peptidylprolyl isomerase [Bryobacteraceae bacterium]|nr:peptidylprolyl isomerase [Bryobacteraceae bacterium]
MKFLVPLLLAVSGSVFAATDAKVVEEIVAKCNGDIVTRSDLEKSRAELIEALKREGLAGAALDQKVAEESKHLLQDRIDSLLLVQKGKDLNINVDSELAKRIAQVQKQSGIADPDKFHEWVREQVGMPFEDFRNEQKNQMLRERVIRQEVGERVSIKREEMEKYYNEHKADFVREERIFMREILVSTEGKDEAGIAAAKKKADDLVSRARRGERFPELARDNSDSVTAKSFGALDPYKKGFLAPALENAVWDKPKGYVTDPITVPAGFLILRVEEHQKAGQAELNEVEGEIQDRLYAPRMQPMVREYLTKLRKEAFLEIKPDYVDSGAAPGKDTSWVDPAQLKPETITKAAVASQSKHKRLLWMVPVPGTHTGSTSSSQ